MKKQLVDIVAAMAALQQGKRVKSIKSGFIYYKTSIGTIEETIEGLPTLSINVTTYNDSSTQKYLIIPMTDINAKEWMIIETEKNEEPEKPTALSWKDIQSALKQGKKCRRQQWHNRWYIMQDKNGEILFHFADDNDTQEETFYYKNGIDFEQDIKAKDWEIIDKNK